MGKYNEGICRRFRPKARQMACRYINFPAYGYMKILYSISQTFTLNVSLVTNIYAIPGKCYNEGAKAKEERPCADAIFWSSDISDAALLRILETLEARGGRRENAAATSSPPTARRRWRTGAYFPCAGALRAPAVGRLIINARSETAQEKATVSRRGALPFAGERLLRVGRQEAKHARYAFARPGGAIYMAGLWRREADGEKRFVILTREATAEAARVHRAHARAVRRGAAPRLAGRAQSPAGTLARGRGRTFPSSSGNLDPKARV